MASQTGLGLVPRRSKVRTTAAEKPEEQGAVRATLVLDGRIIDVPMAATGSMDVRDRIIVSMTALARSSFLVDPCTEENGNRAVRDETFK